MDVEQDVLRGAPVPVCNPDHYQKAGGSPKMSSESGSNSVLGRPKFTRTSPHTIYAHKAIKTLS